MRVGSVRGAASAPTRQQIPTAPVHHPQRVAPHGAARPKLLREIDRPDGVRCIHRRHGRFDTTVGDRPDARHSTRAPWESRPPCSARAPRDSAPATALVHDRCADPVGMLPPGGHNRLHELGCRRLRMRVWPPRSRPESVGAFPLVAADQLIPRGAASAICWSGSLKQRAHAPHGPVALRDHRERLGDPF